MADKGDVNKRIAEIRADYARDSLDEGDLSDDPIEQLRLWMDEAVKADVWEPNAMTLATVGEDGSPTTRIVLIRRLKEKGPVFFTNYESRKGKEIARNPRVSGNIFWPELQRQIRMEGYAERIPSEESDAYFNSRPEKSRIGAWASEQSREVPSREALEKAFEEKEAEFRDRELERPPHWGGYCIVIDRIEFWQGRPDRMHDRIECVRKGEEWSKRRLSP